MSSSWALTSPGCVHSSNIYLYTGQTAAQCQQLCINYGTSCVDSNVCGSWWVREARAVSPSGDCQLQSSADTTGCNGDYYNLDFTPAFYSLTAFSTIDVLNGITNSVGGVCWRQLLSVWRPGVQCQVLRGPHLELGGLLHVPLANLLHHPFTATTTNSTSCTPAASAAATATAAIAAIAAIAATTDVH